MTGINTYSTIAANNVNATTGINWDEGMSPGAVNNSARQNMADMRAYANNPEWFRYGKGDVGYDAVYVSSTSYKVVGTDASLPYHVGRRTRVIGTGTGTIYGTIVSVAFSTDTTVTVVWDSGSLSNEVFTSVSLGPAIANYPIGNMKVPTRQVLTSGSSATYTTPAGTRQLRIRMIGGGGGGGNGNAATPNAGGTGGTTSFNSITAIGGTGGAGGATSAPGLGGAGGTGGSGSASIRLAGGAGIGGSGFAQSAADIRTGSAGGASPFGGAGISNASTAVGGAAVANTGSGGGSGGFGTGGAPGGGGGAGEYVELIINSPSSTYTYTIGASGAAGAASAGNAGGAGGSGIIIVDEFY